MTTFIEQVRGDEEESHAARVDDDGEDGQRDARGEEQADEAEPLADVAADDCEPDETLRRVRDRDPERHQSRQEEAAHGSFAVEEGDEEE
ncbi:MAG: hypothetical protein PGMFKBFP_01751 [Anaerolineales bacterium]|nr:hypothetical protein [Anaerolineales bacterium]